MGSPISPIVANCYMEDFEIKAINTAEHPPRIWKRYVDDTFVILESSKKEKVPRTYQQDECKCRWVHPLPDTLVIPQSDNSPITSVYRKPTHTQIYICNGTVIIT